MKAKKRLWLNIISIVLALSLVIPMFANTVVFADLNLDEYGNIIEDVVDYGEILHSFEDVVEDSKFVAQAFELDEASIGVSTIPINAHFHTKWQYHDVGEPIVINERIGARINLQAFYFTAEHTLPCDKHDNGNCSKSHSWACGERYIPPTGDIAAYSTHAGCVYPVKSPACTNVSCVEGRVITGRLATNNTVAFQWYESDVPTNNPANARVVDGNSTYGRSQEYLVNTSFANGEGTKYYFVEVAHTRGSGQSAVVTRHYSDSVQINIGPFGLPMDQMLPSERSGYRQDTRSAEVNRFLETMVAASEGRLRLEILGYTLGIPPLPPGATATGWQLTTRTNTPQPIYLVVMNEKGAHFPEGKGDVDPNKAVFLVNAGIHSGEYAPKESMLLFIRDVAHGKHDDILKDLVVLCIPNHNADGNDYSSGRGGNRQTMGVINPHYYGSNYTNANDRNAYNINRDSTKLDSPEARALTNVLNKWDPIVYMDLHEGSTVQRESNTWAHGLHKGSYGPIREYNRLGFFEAAMGEDSYIVKEKNKRSVIYAPSATTSGTHGGTHGSGLVAGPMQSGRAQWRTFQDHPRFNTNYVGLRNRVSFLNETYASEMSVVRIDTQYDLCLSTMKATISEMATLKKLVAESDAFAYGRKNNPNFPDGEIVVLESTMGPRDHDKEGIYNLHTYLAGTGAPITASISGGEGRVRSYAGLANYPIMVMDNFQARRSTPLGAYYLIDSDCDNVFNNLKMHGIEVSRLERPITLKDGDFQWFDATERMNENDPAGYFEGRKRARQERRDGVLITDGTGAMIPTWRGNWVNSSAPQTFPSGTIVVSTAQPLGMLAAILVEPGSNDGLFNWNYFQEVFDQNPFAVNHFDNRLDNKQGMVRSNYPTSVATMGATAELTYHFPVFKVSRFIDELKPFDFGSTIPINAHFHSKWQYHDVGHPIVINETLGGRVNLQAFYFTAEHNLPCDKHDGGNCSKTHSWACGEVYKPPTGDIAAYNNAPHAGCAYPVKGPNCTNVSCFDGRIITGVVAANNTIAYQWYRAGTRTNDPAQATPMNHQSGFGRGREYIVDTGVELGAGTRYYFVELIHTVGSGANAVVNRYYSDPVQINYSPFPFPEDQMLPSERLGYRQDTRSADVNKFLETITAASGGRIRMDVLGHTLGIPPLPVGATATPWQLSLRNTKPQPIYLLVVGEPGKPLPLGKEDVDPDKAVFMVNAGIHSGEWAAKESMLLFARDLAHGKYDDMLKDSVVLIIPNHNADGNDYTGTALRGGNRQTMGVINPHVNNARYTDGNENNAYNVNRDSTKLDSPEARALIKVLNEWDPIVYMDLHQGSTNQRESNTWAHGLHKGSYEPIREYNRLGFFDVAMGEDSYIVREKNKRSHIYSPGATTSGTHGGTHGSGFVAGPMQSGRAQWRTFQDHPRFNTNYVGLRNRITFLNETYSSDMSVVRVDTQYDLCLSTWKATIKDKDTVKALVAAADAQAAGRRDNPKFPDGEFVILESVMNPRDHDKEGLYNLHTYLSGSGGPLTATPTGGDGRGYAGLANYPIMVMDNFDARVSTPLGAYYLIDSDCDNVFNNLKMHGIEVSRLAGPLTIGGGDFQWFDATERMNETEPAGYFEGRQRARREVRGGVEIIDGTGAMIPTWRGNWVNASAAQTFPAGTIVVSTAQPLGMLAAILVEPGSNDGLFNWNYFQEVFDQNPFAVNHFDNRLDNKEGMVRSNYPTAVATLGTTNPVTYYFPVFKVNRFLDQLGVSGSTIPINAHFDKKWQFHEVGEPVSITERIGGRINLQAFYFTAEHTLPCDKHDNGNCSKTHSWACGEKYTPPTGDIAAYNNAPHAGCVYPVKGPDCTNVSCFDGRILTGTTATGSTLRYQWYEAEVKTNNPALATLLEYERGREYIVNTSVDRGTGTRYYFVELTHTRGSTVERYYSDPVEVKIAPFAFPMDQMLTSERSGYRVTTRTADVNKFLEAIAAASEGRVRLDIIGHTLGIPKLPAGVTGAQAIPWRIAMRDTQPEPIYLLVMGDKEKPLPANKDEVDPDKAVFLVNAGIHAGEVSAKESMLLFARDVAHGMYDDLLKDLVVLNIPNHNASGNDYLGGGFGARPNVIGNRQTMAVINPAVNNANYTDSNGNNAYNINRDSTKLDAPETRALVKVLNEWDPIVYMDLHEGGTIQRESNTWAHGLHKGSYEPIREYNRLGFFDAAMGEDSYIVKEFGKRSVIYAPSATTSGVHGGTHGSGLTAGPMQSGTAQWRTFQDHPRFNTNYVGLRNRISFLNETYASDMFVVRVDTQYNLCLSTMMATVSEMDTIKKLVAEADAQAIGRKDNPNFPDGEFVILESVMNPRDHDKEGIYNLHTYLAGSGAPFTTSISSGEPAPDPAGPHSTTIGRYYAGLANYPIMIMDNFDARKSTPLGAYYLLDPDCENVVANLRRHGIQVDVLDRPVAIKGSDFQWFDASQRGNAEGGYFEGRRRVAVDPVSGITDGTGAMIPTWRGEWENTSNTQIFPAGTFVVSTAQPLGMLAAILLEPGSNDGLFNWTFYQEVFDQNPLAVNHFDNRLDNKAGMVRANYPSVVTVGVPGTYYFPIFKVSSFATSVTPITSLRINANVTETVARGKVYNFGLNLNEGASGSNIVWTVSDPSYALADGADIYILNKTGTIRLIATDPAGGISHSITLRIAS